MLNGLHRDVIGSAIIELLAKKSPQRRFSESLIEAALERDVFLNEHILLEGGKSIKMENLLKSRYFKRIVEKVKDLPKTLLNKPPPNMFPFLIARTFLMKYSCLDFCPVWLK